MKLEIVFFRLALFLAVAGTLVSGGYAAASYYQAQSWRETVRYNYAELRRCSGGVDDYRCILPQEELLEKYDTSVRTSIWYDRQTELLLHLAWLIPVLVMSSFYAIRWLILGRLKPLWPARANTRDSA